MKDSFRTEFSPFSLIYCIGLLIPIGFWYIFHLPTDPISELLSSSPSYFNFISVAIELAMVASFVFVRNKSAHELDQRTRLFSLSFIFYGVYWLSWVMYFMGHSSLALAIAISYLADASILLISIDRKNWVTLSLACLDTVYSTIAFILMLVLFA